MNHDATYSIELTSEPFAEPLDAQEMKDHLRVDGESEDAIVGAWVTAARRYVEDKAGRQFVTATARLTLDRFPFTCNYQWLPSPERRTIVVPRAPLQSVTSITYVDAGGDTQTLSANSYRVDVRSPWGRITPAFGLTWPVTRPETSAVTVTCVIGHMTPFTVANATNICTAKGRTFTDGDRIRVMNSGGALPAGLAKETDYYVRDVSGSTFKLAATSGGTAIDITDDGQGTHFASNPSAGFGDVEGPRAAIKLLAAHWYENREGVNVGNIVNDIPMGIEALITQAKVFG
jgi:uncharacterized phiE125 gp8 family phage protein